MTGNEDSLDPIIETIHELVDELAPEEADDHGGVLAMHENTLTLVLLALGDALIGKALARALKLPDSAARDRAEELLTDSIAARQEDA